MSSYFASSSSSSSSSSTTTTSDDNNNKEEEGGRKQNFLREASSRARFEHRRRRCFRFEQLARRSGSENTRNEKAEALDPVKGRPLVEDITDKSRVQAEDRD